MFQGILFSKHWFLSHFGLDISMILKYLFSTYDVSNIVLDTEFMWRDRTLSLPTRAHKGADAIWHGPCHGVVNRQGGASIEEGQLNHF